MDRNALLDCPTCALPVEIIDRFLLDGSPYPVEHVKLRCVRGHWFTVPTDGLAAFEADRNGGRTASIFHRALIYLKEFWDECDYAHRRLREIRLGVPMR